MCTHLHHNCHLHSLQWARLRHSKVACHTSCIVVAPALTDLDTRRFGILLFHAMRMREKCFTESWRRFTGRCLWSESISTWTFWLGRGGAPNGAWIGLLPPVFGKLFLLLSLKRPTLSVMSRSPKNAHHPTLASDALDDTASVVLE